MSLETTQSDVLGFSATAKLQAAEVIANLVKQTDVSQVITAIDLPEGVATFNYPIISALTATTVTDGSNPAANVEAGPTLVTFTPVNYEAVQSTISVNADHASLGMAAVAFGAAAAEGCVRKWNQAIYDLGSGFTATAGASGSAYTPALIASGCAQVREQVGYGAELYYLCTPSIIATLTNDAIAQNNIFATQTLQAVYDTGKPAFLFGATIVPMNVTVADTENVVSAIVTKDALGIAFKSYNGSRFDVREVPQALGTQYTGFVSYEAKELQDGHGVTLRGSVS